MTDATLVGFAADTSGREGSLLWADPVVRVLRSGRDRVYVLRGGSSSESDWVEIARGVALGSVSYLDAHNEIPFEIDEPRVVWLAGPRLFNDVSGPRALNLLWKEFGGWKTAPRGYRMKIDSLENLEGFRHRYAKVVREAIFSWLASGPSQQDWPEGERLLRILATIDTVRSPQRAIVRALMFDELGKRETLELERRRATIDGTFRTRFGFDRALRRSRRWLSSRIARDKVRVAGRNEGEYAVVAPYGGGSAGSALVAARRVYQLSSTRSDLRAWFATERGGLGQQSADFEQILHVQSGSQWDRIGARSVSDQVQGERSR
jgi:hypothetical protein